jgi:hypothetical protein
MGFRKGQAALDFLMTYGWAIALVVIIAAVLFALGIFDTSNFIGNKAAGFAGVAVKGWGLSEGGQFTIKLSNQVGVPINVTKVNITIGGVSQLADTANGLGVGADSATLNTTAAAFGVQTAGTGYNAKVVISYVDTNANFNYTTSGTLTGKVQ